MNNAYASAPIPTLTLATSAPAPRKTGIIQSLADSIDLSETSDIMTFGSKAQEKVVSFYDEALASLHTRDMGAIGDTLSSLVLSLRGFDPEKYNRIPKLFGWRRNSLSVAAAKASTNVAEIEGALKAHKAALEADSERMDKLRSLTNQYCAELALYIEAAELKLSQTRANELEDLRQAAELDPDSLSAIDYADLQSKLDCLERRIAALKSTRAVSLQLIPQTQLIQEGNSTLCDKITESLCTTIPLWKGQMVIAISLDRSQKALSAQEAVTKATNDLIARNANLVASHTQNIAKMRTQQTIDPKVLKAANDTLVSAMEELQKLTSVR